MKNYILGSFREFKNIRWLKRNKALVLAFVSLTIAVLVGFFLGFLDSQTTSILNNYINK